MSCTLCTKRGIPCICSLTTNNACDACRQAHKKFLFIYHPFRPRGQRSYRPRSPCKDSFVVDDDETISAREWTPGPQAGRWERFRMISPVPSSIDLSTPPPRPPSNDSPVPSLPCEQTPRQPTPGPSGTRWSEELFREPTRTKEPPIPGPSPSSQPPEDNTTCEPKPEVAHTQSTEEPYG
ncbi:hypothetical protein O181_080890, partial [Austropuccinia psidii MF-1]|nr:hypothetical protein [Austropuccinia psidii MF-1]